jgi:hypothetical protein
LVAHLSAIKTKLAPEQWLAELIRKDEELKAADAAARPDDRWILLSEDSDSVSYADRETVEQDGDVMTLWIKVVFKPNSESARKGLSNMVSEYYFDCADRTSLDGEWMVYGTSGDVIDSGPSSDQWDRVLPESVGEAWWKAACE